MGKKNKKLLLILGVLLLLGGVTFAYFVGSSMFGGEGSTVEGITANINGAELRIEGNLEFNDLDILPGHKNISSIKVTATGNNELIPYNLIWKGTNSLNTPLNYTVYKTSNEIETNATCEKKTKVENGAQILNEECTITNEDKLGSIISSGTINKSEEETKEILVSEEFITATSDGMSVYYYIILEYPNLDEDQSNDMGGTFQGQVTAEESNAKSDINILAVKIEQEDGTYQDSEDIPQSGYIVNEEKSVCSNGATPTGEVPNITVNNLTKNGTSCYLYFDKINVVNGSSELIASLTVKTGTPNFAAVATTDEGVYKATDESGKDSYYWRGAVENNYVKFANKFWRIIRINGDGSIRLIYDGTSIHNNGTSTIDSIAVTSQPFSHKDAYWNSPSDNAYIKDNMYVGFKYTSGQAQGTVTKSNILEQLETWYSDNLASYASKLDTNAGFCGDRRRSTTDGGAPNGTGGTATTDTYYAARYRLYNNKTPELSCEAADFYTVSGANKGNKSLTYPIGLITADEVSMAGGVYGTANQSYYLYNSQVYWTLSPSWLNNVNNYAAHVFSVTLDGYLYSSTVHNSYGIRPIINLRSDVTLTLTGTGEKGSMTNPYIVE